MPLQTFFLLASQRYHVLRGCKNNEQIEKKCVRSQPRIVHRRARAATAVFRTELYRTVCA
jgi:hypothetical protein